MSGDPRRRALDAELLAWMGEPWGEPDPARFDALALALFAYQFEHCRAYGRLCRARGVSPADVVSPGEIPAVPTGAFKELSLTCFPAERERHVFRTSGTSTDRRGALHLDTLDLYEASLLPTFERFVLAGLEAPRIAMLVLAAASGEQPDSSLSHMFEVVRRRRGDAGSRYFLRGGKLASAELSEALEEAAAAGRPVLLCGTSVAIAHLVESPAFRRVALPPGSRVMETGGFKGLDREWDRDGLWRAISEQLGVPAAAIVNQYGMTELGSQFYDSVLARPGEPRRKLGPPWARVLLRDPETGAEVADGEVGVIHVLDLANTGSVLAIQTADLGRRLGDGFEVLGREPGAEARGCSLAADLMLGGAG